MSIIVFTSLPLERFAERNQHDLRTIAWYSRDRTGANHAEHPECPEGGRRQTADRQGEHTYSGNRGENPTQKSSIGKGATSVKASQPSSFWVEDLDVDDDGVVETSDCLYDAQRRMLYTYRDDDFACPNGKPESGNILMALYAKGNKAHQPVGSGWYMVKLNAGQCAAKKAGTFGCNFDAHGQATACGAATLNDATGELDVVTVTSQ